MNLGSVQRAGWLLGATIALAACNPAPERPGVNYSIVISGTVSPRPVRFSGSYQFLTQGERITRDLSGSGTFVDSFFADELVYIRVNRTSEDGLYSMTVSRDGEVLFESPATGGELPLVYIPDS